MALKFPARWRLVLALSCGWFALATSWPAAANGGTPSVEQALKLTPVQRDVDYDRPTAEEAARCTIKAEKHNGQTGWIIRDAEGKILREFVDTNGDNVVDRWSYYKDGVEVYRDIDAKFNGKATEFRWFNTAGTRIGISRAADGRIDYWKAISAEEASAEVVMALRDRDFGRFSRLLLSPAELRSLGFNATETRKLSEKLSAAPAAFNDLARSEHTITAKSNWVHFAGTRPGLVPAGTFGSPTDLLVYENVIAVVDTEGHNTQIQIGTMIKVGDCWRLVDAPKIAENDSQVAESPGYYFFAALPHAPAQAATAPAGGPTEKVQKMMEQLQTLDASIAKAKPESQPDLNDQRADLLEQIIAAISDKERPQWIHQLADTVSAAVQSGSYPRGAERLRSLYRRLESNPADADLAAYVEYRGLQADYALSLQGASSDEFSKIQTAWLENLGKFVHRHPKTPDAADAMLQLGIAEEFAGHEDKARQWYGQVVANFASAPAATKAAGAVRRLESVGQPMKLAGKSTAGDDIDLANFSGKFVLVHYWATWCEPSKVDLAELKELQAKYSSNGLVMIGVSLDGNREALDAYLATNRLPWPQLQEPGGLDSRYANEMGILTVPTMILIDDQGRVINRNVQLSELEKELKAKLKN